MKSRFDEISQILENQEYNDHFILCEVMKSNEYGTVEKVKSKVDEKYYIRKYSIHERSKQEYALLSVLQHPGLPKIHKTYMLADRYILIEEYIEGRSLQSLVEQHGKLQIDIALDIMLKVCDIVDYLHQQWPMVIHRDIKPSNILYKDFGDVVLIDFGAARRFKEEVTQDTQYVGTIGYAPPEQFGFGQTDQRSDIYAVAMTFVYLITGEQPNRGEREMIKDKGLPVLLTKVLEKATSFDPKNRYRNIQEFKKQLLIIKAERRFSLEKVTLMAIKLVNKLKTGKVLYYLKKVVKWVIVSFAAIVLIAFLLDNHVSTWQDRFVNFLMGIIILIPICLIPYMFILNIGNMNERWKFFHTYRIVKKIILWIIAMVLIGYLGAWTEQFYTQQYKDDKEQRMNAVALLVNNK